MSIEQITTDEFNTAYTAVTKQMITMKVVDETTPANNADPSLFNYVADKLVEEFNSGGYSNEQRALAVGQFYASAYGAMESQATAHTRLILESAVQFDLIQAQTDGEKRRTTGFDDNLRVKEAEFNGQVAAFAVNATSTNMAEVVARFNNSIDAVTPTQTTVVTEGTAETVDGVDGHNYTITTTTDAITDTYWQAD